MTSTIRALQLLGRATVRAIVRRDLEGKPDRATELFVRDNLNRRHLDPLSLARCYVAIRDTMKSDSNVRPTAGLREAVLAKLAPRDRLAKGEPVDREI